MALGVDAVWLSPFYPSELADGGYDVIDYRDVDPRLGTMDDFDEMTLRAHEAGIKAIVDIVLQPHRQQASDVPRGSCRGARLQGTRPLPSSARDAVRTVNFRRMTGSPCSAA
ncbi:MAG: alpha-amylase family glycosyl hydrolase [Bifidobacterium adolescentis]